VRLVQVRPARVRRAVVLRALEPPGRAGSEAVRLALGVSAAVPDRGPARRG